MGIENSERYKRYIHSSEWKEKRDQRMKIDNYTCRVCGRPATEVHHLTYVHLGDEPMEDLVSLCHDCHEEAGNIADGKKFRLPKCYFMTSMRIDAEQISQEVFDYLTKVRGSDFKSLWEIRNETEKGKMDYWSVLRNAVNALCRYRYFKDEEDRKDISLRIITNHTIVKVCLSAIMHNNRNFIQESLKDYALSAYEKFGSYAEAGRQLGIKGAVVSKLAQDPGGSGPTLRESILYYCALDAAAGIKPMEGFSCLTEEDYEKLNDLADSIVKVTEAEFTKEG